MKLLAASVILFSMVSSVPEYAVGQWSQMPIPSIYNEVCPYFLNKDIGFIYDAWSAAIQPNLRRTSDGGQTWQTIQFFDNLYTQILQLYFTSPEIGYAATSSGIYKTTDMGNTWNNMHGGASCHSVYASGNTVFSFGYDPNDLSAWGPLQKTVDGGNTWTTIIPVRVYTSLIDNRMLPYVFGNKDSTVFAEDIINNNMVLLFSTDNGITWKSQAMDIKNRTFTMGFFSFPHCNDLLRTYIPPLDFKDEYLIVHSSDMGLHWDTVSTALEIGAWIAGSNCIQYVSDALGNQIITHSNGLYRSQGGGKSWAHIKAPDFVEIDDQDFHNLSVVGNGAVVYAGDSPQRFVARKGNLWKTSNGGDGILSFTPPGSQLTMMHELSSGGIDTLSISICDTGTARMMFQNNQCSIYANLDSISIDGLNQAEFRTELKHHLLCDGVFDTLTIFIIPASGGNRNLTVHAHFINDEFYPVDTSFAFVLKTIPGPNASIYLKPGTITVFPADTAKLPLYINSSLPGIQNPNIDSAELMYSLNTDLLAPIKFISSVPGITADSIKISGNTASFILHFPSGFTFSGETEIGELRSFVYVTDTMESGISLTGNIHSTGCESILDIGAVNFLMAERCGDSSLRNMIKYGSSLSIKSIIPNPARNSVSIDMNSNSGGLRYELFDALGSIKKSESISTNSFAIDLSEIPSGNYYLRISSDKNIPITRRLLIAK